MSLRWLPNGICVGRILLVVPIVALLLDERFVPALALIAVAGASDALDGFLAKHFDWRSRIGGILDPAADKLLLTSVFVTLTYIGLVPPAVTLVVVLRDLIIVCGAASYHLLIGPLRASPTAISKVNTGCQLLFVIFTITRAAFGWPPHVSLVFLGAAVIFTSAASGLDYVVSWSKRAWREGRAAH